MPSRSRKRPSGNCPKCGTWRLRLHRDHFIPKWKGGVDDESNWQYMCANCHEDKTRAESKGRVMPESMRAKLRGRKLSEEHRARLSEAARNRVSPARGRGYKLSLAHRAALAEGQRRSRERNPDRPRTGFVIGSRKGCTMSAEAKQEISDWWTIKRLTRMVIALSESPESFQDDEDMEEAA